MSIESKISVEHIPGSKQQIDRYIKAEGTWAGLDLGKSRHPSHLSMHLLWRGIHYQVASVWFDSESYSKQLEVIDELLEDFNCQVCKWDNTRGELEVLREQAQLDVAMLYGGVHFTAELKSRLAAQLNLAIEKREILLLDDERQRRSILQVNSLLRSSESMIGHGEAFWSNGLALEAAESDQFIGVTTYSLEG